MGVLGAARIAPAAVVRPARAVPDVLVTAVAARDRARAEAFAARHGIPRVLPDYRSLVEDPDLDAVYIPLPNGLHGAWTNRSTPGRARRALAAVTVGSEPARWRSMWTV